MVLCGGFGFSRLWALICPMSINRAARSSLLMFAGMAMCHPPNQMNRLSFSASDGRSFVICFSVTPYFFSANVYMAFVLRGFF